jgi:hypothetical protein
VPKFFFSVSLSLHHLCPTKASKAATLALNAEKSPAVPFLPYPENLKGYIGDDIGFDPLRISDYFPMDYLRESELKYVFWQETEIEIGIGATFIMSNL